ncbi:hypothetical protein NX801_00740 [Streptomyces sp. LP05-1]|uniref:Uncharacterized protein n=1 Tax=Streptomyces pyxinae TaxID=2970734 RepID=A0ABT2CA13_9ACTN|nr:hypothetical protein [Streptomyces sp. LP05-1]MCS0634214.1 hypothetical protein [Streptomyces sp. LP05-1]
MAADGRDPTVRLGDISGSSFSIGGSGNHNTTTHTVRQDSATPEHTELLAAVRELRAALAELPHSGERTALDTELAGAAGELERAGAVRPGPVGRLRAALEHWAPLVETVSAATALAGLLQASGG